MRKSMLRARSTVVQGSTLVVLLFTLFTMTSITAFAHDLNRQSARAPSSGGGIPSGKVDLEWNPQTQALTATVHLSGLQLKSSYANHIHVGDCSIEGEMLYPLNNVVTDAAGNGTAMTTLKNITGGILASGWDIIVHRGATAETGRLLCGNIVNPGRATSVTVSLSLVDPMD